METLAEVENIEVFSSSANDTVANGFSFHDLITLARPAVAAARIELSSIIMN